DINIQTEAGWVAFPGSMPRIEVNLGPVDSLVLQADATRSPADGSTPFDVDQLSWLKVQPSNVLLDTMFVVDAGVGDLRELAISCDPRLILLGKPAEGAAAKPAASADRVVYRLAVPDGVAGNQTVSARFLLKDTAAIGSLAMPRIEVLGANRVRRWFAVSIDANHVAKNQTWTGLDPAVAEFVRRWSAGSAQPPSGKIFSAFHQTDPNAQWKLAIEPRAVVSEVDSEVDFVIDRRWTNVRLVASFVTRAGYRVQHVVKLPANMTIDAVRRYKDGRATQVRWRRSGAEVTCLFDEPQRDSYSLEVIGRIPTRLGERMKFADVSVAGVQNRSGIVRVYRHEAVAVGDVTVEGLAPVDVERPDEPVATNSRLLHTYRADGQRPFQISALCVPNLVDAVATSVISPSPAENHWHFEYAAEVEIKSGILDRLTLELPSNCTGPYEVIDAYVDG
ncbi:MAG: hypothetical protein MI757_22925, partial [Pirellulales bacterium]|nr:hypothetical protein [Pirellulales bacterium]